ncbi:6-bladed beta-propeller [Fodinibius salsisoli]|uniref:6-bladed beta-propeller n=1 Tax=Fodinibius salsisoli TaxID=2820877 RepID=A0ABT3PJQ2_9BACT|nr:6-bladed beta-propeller [Fodinibius salsisoli]MCW9706171.1 6-bladed beta-propeller [Fodinibius salsisoli]
MKFYSIKRLIVVILLFQIISCKRETPSQEKTTDPYIENLKNRFAEISVSSENIPISSSIQQPHRVKVLQNNGYLVVVDDANKSIMLLNKKGEVLSTVGREGRGPEEFLNITQLHVSDDGRIFLLDMLLFRITVYEFFNDELRYVDTFPYKNPPKHSLHSIYVTEKANYGVYNQTEGFQTPDNSFLLYRLDEDFNTEEQLLEIPGNKRQKVIYPEFTLYLPNIFLSNTLWDVDGDWFYYMMSYQSSINKYNLRTGEHKVLKYAKFPKRLNKRYYLSFMKERLDLNQDERQLSVLENSERLPLFSGLWVHENKIMLRIFYPAEENGMMIYIDQKSEEIKYIKAPHEFYPLAGHDNRIYGINFRIDDYYQLMFIDLHY